MSDALRFDGVTLGYGRRSVVSDFSATFSQGSLTAIVGPNGAGKSTLLAAAAGRLAPTAGTVRVTPDRNALAYLPQRSRIDQSFPIGVRDVVTLGLWRRTGLTRSITAAMLAEVHDALAAVGMAGQEDRTLAELSAGQCQRVLFARTLLQGADLILLDEPFAAVDARTIDDLLALMTGWHRDGRTVIAVIHDLDTVRRHFPSTLLIARRTIAYGATTAVLRDANLAEAQRVARTWEEGASFTLGMGA